MCIPCSVTNYNFRSLISFSELNKYQLLLPAERTSTRIDLERIVTKEKAGLKLNPVIEVSTSLRGIIVNVMIIIETITAITRITIITEIMDAIIFFIIPASGSPAR